MRPIKSRADGYHRCESEILYSNQSPFLVTTPPPFDKAASFNEKMPTRYQLNGSTTSSFSILKQLKSCELITDEEEKLGRSVGHFKTPTESEVDDDDLGRDSGASTMSIFHTVIDSDPFSVSLRIKSIPSEE